MKSDPSRQNAAPAPVLVLDADQASTLTIVRSLARRGLAVEVASDAERPLAGRSRHVVACLRYPDPLRDEAGFIAWLRQQLDERRRELVIPVTERTLVPLMRARARFEGEPIAMASTEALEQVLDKDRTGALARSLGIPIPRSVVVASAAEAVAAAQDLGYPVVVKPARSVGGDAGGRVQLRVAYAFDDAGLAAEAASALRHGAVILQSYFRGEGVGIELIADQGELRYAFQHRRLHEVPLTGGGSTLRVSEAPVPALLEASRRLVQALRWHGVAMVEFKYQPQTGAYVLVEINGRFWGSLPLAVAAGADFPAMLHELWTQGRVGAWPPARSGVVARHLARDIDWLEHVLRKAAPPQLVTLPSKRDVLRDWLLMFSPRHHFDVQTWRDPWPGLVDLGRIARHQARRFGAIVAQRRRLERELRAAAPARQRLHSAQRVVFLCHGNINRSALAQAYAESRYPGRHEYASAGFHSPAGRPADPTMVEVAAAAGVDLAQWQSRTLDARLVADADIVFAMEAAHLDRLQREHPGAAGKAYLLGAAIASGPAQVEVPDPYGKPRAAYERVCGQVRAAVDAWLQPTRN
ncbi:MAG: ATP-grasp domain-containing protein [Burkholderiales bacterium]|nr:ATP-grasp domain-containing protein [Burkholderiales bacterium]